jgi:hypothetical protein
MSTVPKTPQTPAPAATSAPRPMATSTTKRATAMPQKEQIFLFDKENYIWMVGGFALILLGFMLMAGGKSADPHQFNYDEIYSFRRITIAPIVVLLGFAVEVYAIMKTPKEKIQEAML